MYRCRRAGSDDVAALGVHRRQYREPDRDCREHHGGEADGQQVPRTPAASSGARTGDSSPTSPSQPPSSCSAKKTPNTAATAGAGLRVRNPTLTPSSPNDDPARTTAAPTCKSSPPERPVVRSFPASIGPASAAPTRKAAPVTTAANVPWTTSEATTRRARRGAARTRWAIVSWRYSPATRVAAKTAMMMAPMMPAAATIGSRRSDSVRRSADPASCMVTPVTIATTAMRIPATRYVLRRVRSPTSCAWTRAVIGVSPLLAG